MGIYKTSDKQQPKRLTQKPHKIPTKQAKANIELLCVCVSLMGPWKSDQAPGDEEAQHVKMMMITDQEIYSTASLFLRKK